MSAIFQPSLLDWLFGSGIGTNLGAAVVWLPIGAGLGFLWGRAKHQALHAKLDRIEQALGKGDEPGR